MIKACLFDLDGTLLNTLNSIRYFLNKTISKRGIREIDEAETKAFVGCGARRLVENVFKSRGLDLEKNDVFELSRQIHDEYVEAYDSEPLYLTEPYEEIPEVVEALILREMKLAVISNKPDPTVKQLVDFFFGDRFSIVEGGSADMPLKPDKTWPLDICKRLGVKPSEVAYIGDTSTDMQTAKNFGAGVAVGVLWGFRDERELKENGADVIISKPSELTLVIDEINKASLE